MHYTFSVLVCCRRRIGRITKARWPGRMSHRPRRTKKCLIQGNEKAVLTSVPRDENIGGVLLRADAADRYRARPAFRNVERGDRGSIHNFSDAATAWFSPVRVDDFEESTTRSIISE
jgi:hypothetical protein